MASLRVNLVPYKQAFTLSKAAILKVIPESLLGQALETDPNITHLDLSHPDAVPVAFQAIASVLDGLEPVTASPELNLASRYLNIPWLLYYADPLYNQLDKPVRITAHNQKIFSQAIQENKPLLVNYLLQKGLMPTEENLETAAERNLTDILALLLQTPSLDPTLVLSTAVEHGHVEATKMLLADPRTNPTEDAETALLPEAVNTGNLDLVKVLLASPKIRPDAGRPDALSISIEANRPDMVAVLLEDPRIDAEVNDYEHLKQAVWNNQAEITRLLLTRANPKDMVSRFDEFMEWVRDHPEIESVKVLLADPRFTQENDLWQMLINP